MKKMIVIALILLASTLNIVANRNFSFKNYGFQPPQEILNEIKIGEQFTITDVPYRIKPPAPFTLKDDKGTPYATNTKAVYSGTTKQPGTGRLVYTVISTPQITPKKNLAAIIPKIAPGVTVLSKLPQPSTSVLAPGRAPSGPGTRTPLRAQTAFDQRIATISEQPAVQGTIATTTSAPVPIQGKIEDIVIPGTPQRIATVDQTAQPQWITTTTQMGSAEYPGHQGTIPTYTSMTTRPQQAGTVIIPEPQYGAASVPAPDTSAREALEAAAKRAKDAAEKLRHDVNLGTMSQEAKQKMLINAVQKTDLDAVKRILDSGFKDNGKALEEAELFALDPDDQNAQNIVNLLKNSQE